LYQKTTYDAAIRYSTLLEELEIHLESSSLAQFLQISKNPAFRDRIYTVYLFNPESDSSADLEVGGANACGTTPVSKEPAEDPLASSEAIRVLTECFRNLETAKNLQRIELRSDHGHDLVLRALSLACFSQKLAHFAIETNNVAKVCHGFLSSTTQALEPYIAGVQIQPSLIDEVHSSHNLSAEQREKNPSGLHIKNYRPTTSEFTKLMSALLKMDSLDLNGCRSHPELRLCHGCDDFFVKNFASAIYPNLSRFTVTSMFISGSRLRRFIKRHAEKLGNVEVRYVSLTDGSWRSIAQGLAKVPHLTHLTLESLRQKGRAKKIARPPQYTNSSTVALNNPAHVQHFLKIFVSFFSTVQYLTSARFLRDPPIYHEAKLFQIPESEAPSSQLNLLRAVAVLRTYAEVDGVR
jgi:hypothetical protein